MLSEAIMDVCRRFVCREEKVTLKAVWMGFNGIRAVVVTVVWMESASVTLCCVFVNILYSYTTEIKVLTSLKL